MVINIVLDHPLDVPLVPAHLLFFRRSRSRLSQRCPRHVFLLRPLWCPSVQG
jgi:hypothetical protein